MKTACRRFALLLISFALLLVAGKGRAFTQSGGLAQLQRSFAEPPDDTRIMMRWWWFGPAVTKTELEREMRLMKEGGIGGFEIQPVYPVALDDPATGIKTLPFLSDEFVDALKFTNDKAHELGLRVDLTIGSGWPYGGPMVPISQASGKLRVERVKLSEGQRRVPVPDIIAGEKLVAVFAARAQEQAIVNEGTKEITEIRDGAVRLPADLAGVNEVLFFISSRTGQQVKRPAVGSEGYVLNHYDRAAIDSYLKNVGDRMLPAFGNQPPHAIFCDSLEVYLSDWAPDMLAEFQKRRGYDLKPNLPALVADFGPQTADIRHDWGQTLTELLAERFLIPMREWSQRNKTLFRIQGYGVPPMTLGNNAIADLPEGEGAQWKILRAARWASSASHLFGRQVTSSETWTWLHSPSFRATPLDVKAEADVHFLQGVNQLIGHGWPYTAEGVEYPGWRFYAAGVFNEKNPWWIVMPDLSRYLQRMSFLMRQGAPANDIAMYLPNDDAWAHFRNERIHMIETLRERIGDDVVAKTLEAGYVFDFFDDESFNRVGRVENGALVLGANKYRAVILPNVERIPLKTLKALEEFARSGGLVIATRRKPELAPGLKATEAEKKEVREISQRLFDGVNAKAHFVADEKTQLASKLNSLLRPDVNFSGVKNDLGFIHRHTPEAEVYFVVNTSNTQQTIKANFRVSRMQAELWDPFSGAVAPILNQVDEDGGISVPLALEPYGSRVIVFTSRSLPRPAHLAIARLPEPIDLSTDWRVSFNGGQTVTMKTLRSWTEDEATRYFSGVATYEKSFAVSEDYLHPGMEIRLDFGEGQPIEPRALRNGSQTWLEPPVREAAVVYLNGERVGSVWAPPYRVKLTGKLKRGENHLRIVVGNTALNHLSGRKLPDYKLLNLRYGERFQAQDMDKVQPLASGLTGAIRLFAVNGEGK
jgi:hypothetical protein